jgi:C4-dicarboxylate transporter, DctM subunit
MTPHGAIGADGEAPNLGRRLAAWFGALTLAMNSVGTLWVFCLMFVICADVVGRYVFDAPIRGAAEMVGYSIVTAVFLQFANTLHAGRFTRADVLIGPLERARPFAGHVFHALFQLVGAAVFGLVVYGTWPRLAHAWATGEVSGTPGYRTFLVWPFLVVIVGGGAATAIEFAIQAVGAIGRAAMALSRPAPDARPGWPAIAALVAFLGLVAALARSDLNNVEVGICGIVGLLVLIYSGMSIGIVLMVLGFAGMWMIRGDPALGIRALSRSSTEYLNSYFFGVVPLFVLMGLLVSVSDVGRDTFDVARWALRRLRGGIGIATVAANAIFASITGSSIASAAVFTKIATPEMLRHGYTPRFSVGVVAGSSVLGMLIPPSLLLIVYGFLSEQSVGRLFLAAVVPGLLLAAAMSAMIVLLAIFRPSFVGGTTAAEEGQESVASAALKLAPILILVLVVLGGIYGGVFTPTEAGGGGALGALLIAIARRKLNLRNLWQTMVETGYVTVSILFLILGARIFGQMLAMSSLPQEVSGLAANAHLGLHGFVVLYLALVILLGTILDSVSIMVITLPFALPVVAALGGDLIWFGIITVVGVEVGLLTPPFGLSCFVVKSTLNDERITINQIFAGAFPFVLIMLLVLALLVALPGISLLL